MKIQNSIRQLADKYQKFPLPLKSLKVKRKTELLHLVLSSPRREGYAKGFTIIELLVVISILAVLSAVSLASLSSYNNSQKLSITTLAVKNMMQFAKSQALSQVNTCTPGQTLVGYRFLACCQGTSCPTCISGNSYEVDIVCSNGASFVKGDKLPSDITFDTANSTSYSFLFNTLSGSVTGAGDFLLKQSSSQKTISVSSTGVIQ